MPPVKTKYDRKKIAEARKKRESSFSFDIDIEPSEIALNLSN